MPCAITKFPRVVQQLPRYIEEKKSYTEEEEMKATLQSHIKVWNLLLEKLLESNGVDTKCGCDYEKCICPRLTHLLIKLWKEKGEQVGELTCEFDGRNIDLLEDYKGKIPTFMDRYSGKEKTLYKYNFVGMAINIDNLRDFQRTWQNWSINEEGFPNNLIPLIFPKKIGGQIQKGEFTLIVTVDKRL